MFASMTVLSMRTFLPFSTPAFLALPTMSRLICSIASGFTRLMLSARVDFFGALSIMPTRQNARYVGESSRWNARAS